MVQATDQRVAACNWSYTNAHSYQLLLGDDWSIIDGYIVINTAGTVKINAQLFEIAWLDLAPEGDPREWQTLRMPKVNSIGATVAVAQALASLEQGMRVRKIS